ncbi:hypothetical protein AVEN_132679-1 [Araneus ventricosus]|uniref:Uncharacterized protein n=1 Tax=Araneus ventricosus TaxID=182803 RepID=A0A4Y2AVQ5_ARAVE|nr:hypothetical protein AVEN_132679-1 [Araneus ventricosus]
MTWIQWNCWLVLPIEVYLISARDRRSNLPVYPLSENFYFIHAAESPAFSGFPSGIKPHLRCRPQRLSAIRISAVHPTSASFEVSSSSITTCLASSLFATKLSQTQDWSLSL